MNRSVTPVKKQPTIEITKIDPDTFGMYLEDGELLVSRGYPAPPSSNKEIRKCIGCHGVFLIVLKTSTKMKCGYCTENTIH